MEDEVDLATDFKTDDFESKIGEMHDTIQMFIANDHRLPREDFAVRQQHDDPKLWERVGFGSDFIDRVNCFKLREQLKVHCVQLEKDENDIFSQGTTVFIEKKNLSSKRCHRC